MIMTTACCGLIVQVCVSGVARGSLQIFVGKLQSKISRTGQNRCALLRSGMEKCAKCGRELLAGSKPPYPILSGYSGLS